MPLFKINLSNPFAFDFLITALKIKDLKYGLFSFQQITEVKGKLGHIYLQHEKQYHIYIQHLRSVIAGLEMLSYRCTMTSWICLYFFCMFWYNTEA